MTKYAAAAGLLFGRAAALALDAGQALPLAGGVAHTHWHVWQRDRETVDEFLVPVTNRQAGQAREHLNSHPWRCPETGPRLMGVVNVTPDSFSDGGQFFDPGKAIAHGRTLVEAGADMLDIGGESTRPGAGEISADEELSRILPVIKGLRDVHVPISVDTRKAGVMRAAIAAGASLINDVSALSFDATSLPAAAELKVPVILMHSQGTPEVMQDNPRYAHVLLDVYDALAERVTAAQKAGIAAHNIMVDPGIGFGKTLAHNLALIRHLDVFHGLGMPTVLGVSRKSFIGTLTGADAAARLPGSLAAQLYGALVGADILRVHDVAEMAQAQAVWRALSGG